MHRKFNGLHFYSARSLSKTGLKYDFVGDIVLYNYDTFSSILNKLKIFIVRSRLIKQDYVKDKVNLLNASPGYQGGGSGKKQISDVKKAKRFVREYGSSDFDFSVVGLRKLSERTGISRSSLSLMIREWNQYGLLRKRQMIEVNGVGLWENKPEGSERSITKACKLGFVYKGRGGSVVRHYGTDYRFLSNVLHFDRQKEDYLCSLTPEGKNKGKKKKKRMSKYDKYLIRMEAKEREELLKLGEIPPDYAFQKPIIIQDNVNHIYEVCINNISLYNSNIYSIINNSIYSSFNINKKSNQSVDAFNCLKF